MRAYIFHDVFHDFYGHIILRAHIAPFHDEEQVAVAFLALGCTWAIAALSFHFFETPFLNLKERLTLRTIETTKSI